MSMNQAGMDEMLVELFDQIIAYEEKYYEMMCSIEEREYAPMIHSQVAGIIQGLRIAVCIVNGWEVDSSDEGTADQAVREYADKHRPEGFE